MRLIFSQFSCRQWTVVRKWSSTTPHPHPQKKAFSLNCFRLVSGIVDSWVNFPRENLKRNFTFRQTTPALVLKHSAELTLVSGRVCLKTLIFQPDYNLLKMLGTLQFNKVWHQSLTHGRVWCFWCVVESQTKLWIAWKISECSQLTLTRVLISADVP